MGDGARCTVSIGDRRFEGKALLEPDELLFRGDFLSLDEPRGAQVLDVGKQAGLFAVMVTRFSETHSAHKLVIPVSRR